MNRRLVLLAMLALPVLASCQSVNTSQTITIHAVVETVDPVAREILLRGNDGAQNGALVTMILGKNIQRLNEIRSGDRVTATYYQALAAKMVTPFSPTSQPFAGVAVSRNDTAELPGGEITRVRQGRVTITAIDRSAGTVSFVGPGNVVRTVSPANPDVQAFIRTLRVGDQVDVLYQEALAISITPMQ